MSVSYVILWGTTCVKSVLKQLVRATTPYGSSVQFSSVFLHLYIIFTLYIVT